MLVLAYLHYTTNELISLRSQLILFAFLQLFPSKKRALSYSSFLVDFFYSPTGYKRICLGLLQLFDSEIVDLLYLKNENTSRAIEYLEHKRLGIMPLASYGDGIKKVLSLANGIASAAGGVLLIDEIETSISYKYYSEIFDFIIMAAEQFDLQVFITTHNVEAIDGILETQSYGKRKKYDPIGVITFRKDPKTATVYTRSLSGREVYEDRKSFNFEVRL